MPAAGEKNSMILFVEWHRNDLVIKANICHLRHFVKEL